MTAVYILFAVFVFLSAVDAVTTVVAIRDRNSVYEQNVLLAWLFDRIGLLPGLVLTKGIGIAAVGTVSFMYDTSLVTVAFLVALVLFYLGAGINNIFVLRGW